MDIDSPGSSTVDAPVAPEGSLRRRLLGAGLLGAAGALLPSLAGRAGATTTTPPAATTTTAPPRRPDAADSTLLAFGQSVELAAVTLYTEMLNGQALTEEVRPVFQSIQAAHLAFGQSISGLLGKSAPVAPLASLVAEYRSAFTGSDLAAVATAAAKLENIAVATHTESIGSLTGTDGANLVAAFITAESRHATVLLSISGETDFDALLVDDAEPLMAEKG